MITSNEFQSRNKKKKKSRCFSYSIIQKSRWTSKNKFFYVIFHNTIFIKLSVKFLYISVTLCITKTMLAKTKVYLHCSICFATTSKGTPNVNNMFAIIIKKRTHLVMTTYYFWYSKTLTWKTWRCCCHFTFLQNTLNAKKN